MNKKELSALALLLLGQCGKPARVPPPPDTDDLHWPFEQAYTNGEACELMKDRPEHYKACTTDYTRNDLDGSSCYEMLCVVPADGKCPMYFVRVTTTESNAAKDCSHHNAVEL